MFLDLFITATVFAIGGMYFGHFETYKPATQRVVKFGLTLVIMALASALIGHGSLLILAALLIAGGTFHFTWTRRHGVDPWTAEPRERYEAALRAAGRIKSA